MENQAENMEQDPNVQEASKKTFPKENAKNNSTKSSDTAVPVDLIDDIKKDKIDPLTEGKTNLGYDEKPPRKKELEQKEHFDQQDK